MRIAGIDEAGRGPLAGPVVAAAVVLPENFASEEIKDSKQLSAKMREKLEVIIKQSALDWAVVAVGNRRIECLNIREASRLAMSLALKRVSADIALIDGNTPIASNIPQKTIVGGDASVLQISAASILAKVYRDRLMAVLDSYYSGYGFSKHNGYPTPSHKEAIRALGPSRVHRRSFSGVKEFVALQVSKSERNLSAIRL